MSRPMGASVENDGVRFTVWAPAVHSVDVEISAGQVSILPMKEIEEGVFTGFATGLGAGARYKFRLDGSETFPDPYSRFQPGGPHRESMVIDPRNFQWNDADWRGITLPEQIIYELHVGTFTETGTFAAAQERLPYLKELGVSLLEIMPIAEFPGRFNWGYDGVDLFAPCHVYGAPDDVRRFVAAAHDLNIGVILDVVYNHVGPDGNYLTRFSRDYFCERRSNDWGTPFNVDGPRAAQVRRFIVDNARYWIEEFHFDGLRLDATSEIPDDSEVHILAEIIANAREAAGNRSILIIAEDEQQQATRLAPAEEGGFGLDAMWNDDFHHSAVVLATGRRRAYLHDYLGRAQEFVSAAKYGFLYQGQMYAWQQQRRGQRFAHKASQSIGFIDNHDQIANSLRGARLHQLTGAARYRAMTAFLILGPQTPMLFMGQEFGASSPFLYFADHDDDLAHQVRKGRAEFLAQFEDLATPSAVSALHDPSDEQSFIRSKLSWSETAQNVQQLKLHKDLIGLRRSDPVLRKQGRVDGAVLAERAFLIRWFDEEEGDRLLVINFDMDLDLTPCPEPLLAPSMHMYWETVWSSSNVCYGGNGVVLPETEVGWLLPGETAMLLAERTFLSARVL